MKTGIFLAVAAISSIVAGSPAKQAVYPQCGQKKGRGILPPKVAKVSYEGTLQSKNANCGHKLGFSGVVNGEIIWTFGDTVGILPNGQSEIGISASDSSALGSLRSPLRVYVNALDSNGLPSEGIPFIGDE